jgi:GTPase SAR1 family protein
MVNMAKLICPYCFEEFDSNIFVCTICGAMNNSGLFETKPIRCKSCSNGVMASPAKCCCCRHKLPKVLFEVPNHHISIVGAVASGKTSYIKVMLHELDKLSEFQINLINAWDEDTYGNDIYRGHHVPSITMPFVIGGEPQIWSISNLMGKCGSNIPTHIFTIFDDSGQNHEECLDISRIVWRYIQSSGGIIFTFDPLTSLNIRKDGIVDENIKQNSMSTDVWVKDSIGIINNIANHYRVASNRNEKLEIPVAVVFTKFDTIMPHKYFDQNAVIRSLDPSVKDGKVNVGEILQISEEIRYWLNSIGEIGFINALESNFKEFCFFGVSSFGETPNKGKLSDKLKPHRVLDPILWLFKKADFVY